MSPPKINLLWFNWSSSRVWVLTSISVVVVYGILSNYFSTPYRWRLKKLELGSYVFNKRNKLENIVFTEQKRMLRTKVSVNLI